MKLSRVEAIMLGLMASVVCLILVVATAIAVNISNPPTTSVAAAIQATPTSRVAATAIPATPTNSRVVAAIQATLVAPITTPYVYQNPPTEGCASAAMQFIKDEIAVLNEFVDTMKVASNTPRPSLAPVIQKLQQNRRTIENIGVPDCVSVGRNLIVKGMNEMTQGIIDVSSLPPTAPVDAVNAEIDSGRRDMKDGVDQVSLLYSGVPPATEIPPLATVTPPPTLALAAPSNSVNSLTENQKAAANDAFKALRKIEAATQVGVTYLQYGPLLIDAKALVNQAALALPPGALRDELNTTIDTYADAGTVWGMFIKRQPLDAATSNVLQGKYSLDFGTKLRLLWYNNSSTPEEEQMKSAYLSTIWEVASQRLKRTGSLLGQ
jgi:hypothetical protein